MSEREFSKISGLPPAIQPIASDTIVEIETADGQSFHAPFSALGGMPASHGSTHQDGGSDEIGTEFPTANAIPKADDAGQLTDWIADASTSVKGKVQLAANNESAANKAVQSNDTRMSNARAPTAHAASHIGGTDDLGLGTAALLDVGVADGVCGLDSSGKVSSSNLPSYVDDVIEVANYAALPVTGETGKIYVTLDDNLTYRWTGSAYVEISKSLALGETSSTAYRGDRGKIAYDHSQSAHAPSNADNTQGAINGAVGETSVAGNDRIPFIDNGSGGALKTISVDDFADAIGGGSGGGSMSVDNSSRVAEYTGDGIPLIPDNVAGAAFIRDNNWSSISPWSPSEASLSYVSGKLVLTATGANPQIYMSVTSYVGKVVVIKVKKTSGSSSPFRILLGGANVYEKSITAGISHTATYYISPSATGALAFVFILSNPGDTYEIEALYIGNGAYDTPALDRAGNGNNLSLTAVTPVNGKYGKEMSFNGSTSYAQASSPVIGTTGTVAVRFKRSALGTLQRLFTNSADDNNGMYCQFDIYNTLAIYISNGTTRVGYGIGTVSDTTIWHSAIFDNSGKAYLDGTLVSSSLPTSWIAGLQNLTIGQLGGSAFLNGIISHFRYDSRVWTADEALAWSLNPSGEDSLSMSENPSAGDVMLWPDGGVSFLRSDNVGSGWATALVASKYSLGTRVLTTQSLTSGTYTIPEGEYWCKLSLGSASTGVFQIKNSSGNWIAVESFITAGNPQYFSAGIIRSDGTNVRVEWAAGTVTINLIRIG